MKRLLALLLALCLLGGIGPASAAADNDDNKQAANQLLNGLGDLLGEDGAQLTDEQLTDAVSQLGQSCQIPLSDSQISQLVSLCRRLQKLDGSLEEKLAQGKETVESIAEAKQTVKSFAERIRTFFQSVRAFFQKLKVFFQKLGEAAAAFRDLFHTAPLPVMAGSSPIHRAAAAASRQIPCS